MKRVLTIIAAIALAAACSKTVPVYEQTGEILMSPVTENVTKLMMPSGEFLGESFNVWAWHNPSPALADAVATFQLGFVSDDNKTTRYVNEKPFIEKDATKDLWGGKIPYYWPTTGSLIFAGYHGIDSTKVKYTFNETDNKMVFSNVQQATVAVNGYAEDLMYFNMTSSSYNKSSNKVSLKFNHALSWITVTLAKRVDPVIEAEIKIESVRFTNVYEKGTGTVEGENPISWEVSDSKNFSLPGLPMVLEYQTVNDKLATKVYTLQEHLFIPQSIEGLLVVTYTVTSTDGSNFTEVYRINLKNLAKGAHNSWDAGKHYTYNLSIGTDEILVTPEVDNWQPVGTDILIPLPEDMYDNESESGNTSGSAPDSDDTTI